MIQILYVSAARAGLIEADIQQILTASRRNNKAVGLTGLLLHLDQAFLQVLEGEEDSVRACVERIGRDKRHNIVMTLLDRETDHRDFGRWSMGYDALEPGGNEADGVFRLTRQTLDQRTPPGAGLELMSFLQTFYLVNGGRAA